jgi:hypothetical protein
MLASHIVLTISPRNSDRRRRVGSDRRSNHLRTTPHIFTFGGSQKFKGGNVAATVHAKSGTVDRQQKQDKLEFISFRKTGQKLHARDSTFDNNAQSARKSEYGTRSWTRAAKFDLDHRPVSKNGSTGRCVSTFYRKTSERVRPQ